MPVPHGSRGIFSIYLPLSHGNLECVSVCVLGGEHQSSAPWLLPCLCPGFSREQISRAGDSRSHEKTVADVSLVSHTL